MQHQNAYAAIQTTVQSFQQHLRQAYVASYLYGSLVTGQYDPAVSDINLLIVVRDEVEIHQMLAAIRQVWPGVAGALKHAPGVAPLTLFQQFLDLNPVFAQHLIAQGKQVKGGQAPLMPPAAPSEEMERARTAHDLLEASAALSAELMDVAAEQQVAKSHFERLVRRHLGPAAAGETAVAQFLQLHAQLDYGPYETDFEPAVDPAPYAIPGLRAAYQKRDMLLLVVDEMPPLISIDWHSLKQQAEENFFNGILFATPAQLLLAVNYFGVLDLKLRSFQHQWGEDLLSQLDPSTEAILRDAARYPARLTIFDFLHQLTIIDDSDLGKFIHDFQNKLLNIRLENELLARFEVCPKFEPEHPLPDRATPNPERVSAIYQRFRDWVSFYAAQQAARDAIPEDG